MSTITFSETLTEISPKDSSVFAVDKKEQEPLADYVQRVRNEKGFSLTEVQKQSGFQITDAYVSRIENGHIKNVSPAKLKALAKGLQVSEDEIFAIARGKTLDKNGFDESEFALMYDDVSKLTPQQKRDFKIAWEMAKDALKRIKGEK